MKEAQQNYRNEVTKLDSLKTEFRTWLQGDAFLYLKSLQPTVASNISSKIQALIQQIRIAPVSDPQDIDEYYSKVSEADQLFSKLMLQFDQLTAQENNRYQANAAQNKQYISTQKIEGLLSSFDVGTPVDTLISSFSFDGDVQQLKSQLLVLAKYLSKFTSSPSESLSLFSKKSIGYLLSCVNSDDLITSKKSVKISLERIINEHQEQLRLIRERASLYDDYCALVSISGVPPKPFNSFKSIDELAAEVNKLQMEYKRKDEMDFIATQINQVMIDLGYQFVSSTSLQRENGSEYDYSLYQADESTGISIYTDESGAVMMQLTTIGDGAVTAQDEEESYQRQLDFCASHPDIVDALMEKGVFLKQVQYEPPAKKHTKKTSVKTQASTKVVDRRKRRRAKSKMRTM